MKPLPIKEQIEGLKELLQTWDIWGMCYHLYYILTKKYRWQCDDTISDYIPSFTHYNYLHFYSSIKVVQKRKEYCYWDRYTISGNLRRRRFIKHLIKELKKQL